MPNMAYRPAHTLARTTDPDTSHDAAHKLHTEKMITRLLRAYACHPAGLTAYEAEQICGYTSDNGVWRRVSDMKNKGDLDYAKDPAGRTIKRKGRGQASQSVLVITPAGLAEHRYRQAEGYES